MGMGLTPPRLRVAVRFSLVKAGGSFCPEVSGLSYNPEVVAVVS